MEVNRASREQWLQLPGCSDDTADLLLRLQQGGAELGAQLLHRELGLEVFRELKTLHEHPVAAHQLLHRLDELLLTLPVELAVLTAQLHQLLVITEQTLGFVLNDVGFKKCHPLECRSVTGNSADFPWSMAVRFSPMGTMPVTASSACFASSPYGDQLMRSIREEP